MIPAIPYRAVIHPAEYCSRVPSADHVWNDTYLVRLNDGSWLEIPITPLPGNQGAIALLMSNQCDFSVTGRIACLMVKEAELLLPDCIVAIPTMGLEYACRVAEKLGHENYVAMGFSQKFWYDSNVYEEIQSSTSGAQKKRLFLDPHLVSRVQGRDVVIVDDVINTGASAVAAVRLLKKLGANVTAALVGLTESRAWEKQMADAGCANVKGMGHIPLFVRHGNGWIVDKTTL